MPWSRSIFLVTVISILVMLLCLLGRTPILSLVFGKVEADDHFRSLISNAEYYVER